MRVGDSTLRPRRDAVHSERPVRGDAAGLDGSALRRANGDSTAADDKKSTACQSNDEFEKKNKSIKKSVDDTHVIHHIDGSSAEQTSARLMDRRPAPIRPSGSSGSSGCVGYFLVLVWARLMISWLICISTGTGRAEPRRRH